MIRLERGERPLPDELHKLLGLGDRRFTPNLPVRAALQRRPLVSCDGFEPVDELEAATAGGEIGAAYLALLAEDVDPGAYGLLTIVERAGDEILGGITFVITGSEG